MNRLTFDLPLSLAINLICPESIIGYEFEYELFFMVYYGVNINNYDF